MNPNRLPLYRLDDDAFVTWVPGCDAPGSHVMAAAECIDAGITPERVEVARRRGHTIAAYPDQLDPTALIAANRAGPREARLTLDALLARYSPGGDVDAPLEPHEISAHLTTVCAPGHPDDGRVFWTPWRPGEAPEAITERTDLRALVPAHDSELS